MINSANIFIIVFILIFFSINPSQADNCEGITESRLNIQVYARSSPLKDINKISILPQIDSKQEISKSGIDLSHLEKITFCLYKHEVAKYKKNITVSLIKPDELANENEIQDKNNLIVFVRVGADSSLPGIFLLQSSFFRSGSQDFDIITMQCAKNFPAKNNKSQQLEVLTSAIQSCIPSTKL